MTDFKNILLTTWRKKKVLYLILLLIALGVFLLYIQNIGGDLVGGLLTEVLGICITVFILDVVISYSDEKRNYKLKRLALSHVKGQIVKLVELFRQQYQTASGTNFAPVDWDKLLKEESAVVICDKLDPKSPCRTIYERPIDWMQHNTMFAEQFKKDLDNIIDKYLTYLSEDLISELENLKNSVLFETYRVSKTLEKQSEKMKQEFRYLQGMTTFYIELFEICITIRSMLTLEHIEMPK